MTTWRRERRRRYTVEIDRVAGIAAKSYAQTMDAPTKRDYDAWEKRWHGQCFYVAQLISLRDRSDYGIARDQAFGYVVALGKRLRLAEISAVSTTA